MSRTQASQQHAERITAAWSAITSSHARAYIFPMPAPPTTTDRVTERDLARYGA